MQTKFEVGDSVRIIADAQRGTITSIADTSPFSSLVYDEPVYRIEQPDNNEGWFEGRDLESIGPSHKS